PEVLPVITALKNVVHDGEAKPNSFEVLERDSKVGIKPGSQREDLWRDWDQEKTEEKKLKSKSAPTSLNNLDINKEELDASYEKMSAKPKGEITCLFFKMCSLAVAWALRKHDPFGIRFAPVHHS
ncbi:22057_t:CDS:2, partial [Gigaspora margarita]